MFRGGIVRKGGGGWGGGGGGGGGGVELLEGISILLILFIA